MSAAGDLAGSRESLEHALALNPEFYPAHINLGSLLERQGDAGQAVLQWQNVTRQLAAITGPALRFKVAALKQIGRVLGEHHQVANAEDVLQQSLDIAPEQPEVLSHYIAYRLSQCKWPIIAPWEGVERKTLVGGIGPLPLAAYSDDPVFQLATAYTYSKTTIGYPALDLEEERRAAPVPAPADRRLRVGYVSSDLREHAVGFLTAELFELHDRGKVEAFAYYCGVSTSDAMNARFKASAEHWIDITGMDEAAAARRIAADGIDILVDLNGYTRDGWLKLFSMRPAPVIINWLGYPGTMGSPFHHYIIADDWIIPPDCEIHYSEKVLRLPCYQPNDRKRLIAPERPTREEVGLPADGMVYCCFNGVHKLSRPTFERWLAILQRVPDSVLWMLEMAPETEARLKDFAQQHGVSGDRLVLARKLANPHHLARYPLADLFLDTLPYGAHTTASDALWMGVPVLTLSGRSFASRVCGSLVRAANIPELICNTPQDYVDRAVALGTDREALRHYKERLAAGRDSCVLFDTPGLVRHLEGLYQQIWDDFRQGRRPLPDLTNLDVYHEIGLDEEREGVDMAVVPDYIERYKAKLARRHRLWTIPPDHRLWTADDIARAAIVPA